MSRGSCSIELFRDTAEIRVERVARGFVAQKRTAVFGGEDQMNVNGGKGLWHVERMVSRVLVCQSQRIASIRPKLARRLLPWVGVRKGPQRQRRCGRRQVRGRERTGHNRVAVGEVSWPMTQGSSCLATLGIETESRWDSWMSWTRKCVKRTGTLWMIHYRNRENGSGAQSGTCVRTILTGLRP